MNIEQLKTTFGTLRRDSTFLSIKEYIATSGEVADFAIAFHVDYRGALKRSHQIISDYKPEDEIQTAARTAILASMSKRLTEKESLDEIDATYVYFNDAHGQQIKGIKAHRETNDLYLFGFVRSKSILTPGTYKDVKSSPLTIAKRKIENLTPISKFRQFKLSPGSFKEIRVERLILSHTV